MRIGDRERWPASPLAKQATKAGRGHGPATPAALQDQEESRFGVPRWSLELRVILEYTRQHVRERQHAVAQTFAPNVKAPLGPHDVVELELQNFARAQPAQEHQMHDGEVSIASKAAQERAYLFGSKWLDEHPRLLHTDFSGVSMKPMKPERMITTGPLVVGCGTKNSGSLIELSSRTEAK